MRRLSFAALALTLGALATGPSAPRALAAGEDPHAYFASLVGRKDHWKSYSLRSAAQLAYPKDGGMAAGNSGGLWITYAPELDTHANKQDAAKIVIPAFLATSLTSTLDGGIDASQTTVKLVSANGTIWSPNSTMKIDEEVLTVVRTGPIVNNTLTVIRGQFGTRAMAHSSGAVLKTAVNSIPNQVRMPLGTTDGHSYLLTWDAYWTDSYVDTGLTNHKTFQLSSGGDSIWFQLNTRFDGGSRCCEPAGLYDRTRHVGAVDARSLQLYGGDANWSLTNGNVMGPTTTGNEPVQPKLGSFVISPNTWTRFWVQFEQRANDYDYVDVWVADETQEAVQIYRRIPVSVRPSGNAMDKFWLEYNTSTSNLTRVDQRDLVSYARNFVALRDVQDVGALLVRPAASARRPAAPRNVRVIQ
jgi:hypothetical protein